jgi:hypothetical protein
MENNEFKRKIALVKEKDNEIWSRLADYEWNVLSIISEPDFFIEGWILTIEEFNQKRQDYKKVIKQILELCIDEIIIKLEQNIPTDGWTDANIKSINKAFWDDYITSSIWITVDKSNATTWRDQVLAPIPYIWTQRRPEEITQAKVYKYINKVRNFLWLPTILPSTPFYKK